MILLIRHAEKTLTGEYGLTKRGFDDAFDYGKRLTQHGINFDAVISSPIKRCMQTSENIVKGMNIQVKVQESTLFGNPGVFVIDDQQAGKAFETFSVCEVINHMLKGNILPGFLSIDKACIKLINEFQTQINSNKSILYVSHDAIIMPFIGYVSSRTHKFNEYEVIDYLDGYVIEKSKSESLHLLTTIKKLHK